MNCPFENDKRLLTSHGRRDDCENPNKKTPYAGETTSVDDVKGVNEVWYRVSVEEFHRFCLPRCETRQPLTCSCPNIITHGKCITHERHPLMLDPVQQERAEKVERDCCVVHVEDLEELRNATPRAVTNGNTRKENHSVVVDEVLDRPLVERKAHVEKPHKDVHDEVFQYGYKLWNVFQSNFIKKRKTAKVSVLDFLQFAFQKLTERGDVFPQILEKPVSCLENCVDIPKNFKDEQCKAEMRVDEGIFE